MDADLELNSKALATYYSSHWLVVWKRIKYHFGFDVGFRDKRNADASSTLIAFGWRGGANSKYHQFLRGLGLRGSTIAAVAWVVAEVLYARGMPRMLRVMFREKTLDDGEAACAFDRRGPAVGAGMGGCDRQERQTTHITCNQPINASTSC